MDGVLIDSEPLHYEANRILLEEKFDIELEYEYYKQYIGTTVTYMWEKIKKDFAIEGYEAIELRKMADDIKEELIDANGYERIQGVAEFVGGLFSHYRLAVASSSYLENIKRNLECLDLLDKFDELVSGTQVKNPKPSPDIFLEAAKRLGVKPCECVVIEDSENGVKAAKTAGMACVGFINPNSGNQDLTGADYLFDSYEGVDSKFLQMVHAHCFDERYEVFDTDRLILREMLAEDVGDDNILWVIKEALSGDKKTESSIDIKNMSSDELIKYIIDYRENSYKFQGFGLWLMETKDSKRIIGVAGVDRKESGDLELGYYVCENYRRRGYAYEACTKILKMMREEFEIEDIIVTIARGNKESLRLARKLGIVINVKDE